MVSKMHVSIVLPVHNESGCIGKLLRELIDVCNTGLSGPSEVIVVDDASDDASAAIVAAVASNIYTVNRRNASTTPSIRLLSHAVRVGQAASLMDGFSAAEGEILISMDADGQFDPGEIPRLLEKMDSCDMVCGVRHRRRDTLIRTISSRVANGFRNAITGDTLSDAGCTFRCMRRSCVAILQPFQGKLLGCEFFFHPLMLRKAGFIIVEIAVSHRPRTAGKSNYRLIRGRMVRGLHASIIARKLLNRRC